MTKEGLINLDFADVRAIMSEMGKAMMGTGEASGEKRAIEAAEAAISNPLLDDVSMRGARGLLISISGGPDLTLYEVDEAATRIREEVDPEANIILGATFDDSLEGTMRVSVVATGLSPEAMHGSSEESSEEQEARTSVTFQPAEAVKVVKPAPIAPRPVAAAPPVPAQPAASAPVQQPVQRVTTQRIPPIEEFPVIAQKQIAAQQSRIEDIAEHAQKRKMGIFERLATVGLGRREEAAAPAQQPAARRAEPKMAPAQTRQAARPQPQAEAPVHAEPAYEDDQLAIPAFLRRQASS